MNGMTDFTFRPFKSLVISHKKWMIMITIMENEKKSGEKYTTAELRNQINDSMLTKQSFL